MRGLWTYLRKRVGIVLKKPQVLGCPYTMMEMSSPVLCICLPQLLNIQCLKPTQLIPSQICTNGSAPRAHVLEATVPLQIFLGNEENATVLETLWLCLHVSYFSWHLRQR